MFSFNVEVLVNGEVNFITILWSQKNCEAKLQISIFLSSLRNSKSHQRKNCCIVTSIEGKRKEFFSASTIIIFSCNFEIKNGEGVAAFHFQRTNRGLWSPLWKVWRTIFPNAVSSEWNGHSVVNDQVSGKQNVQPVSKITNLDKGIPLNLIIH